MLAEGLAEYLSDEIIATMPRDDHGHLSVANCDLGKMVAKRVAAEFKKQTGITRKCTGIQLGYECRCARPHAFDVMLGSQLGVGAYRALHEQGLNGVMVSVSGQLDLHYVPFDKLVDPRHSSPSSASSAPKVIFIGWHAFFPASMANSAPHA
ncbi:MAG UNVERIFIED_CONTAM: hypothetical protein LVR18_22430 [Planctomycetaceae bacterium]